MASSSVGSISGNVNLLAGAAYQQIASNVLAPQGDVNITAPKVDILAGTQTSQFKQIFEAKQSGLTFSITNPVVSAVQTVQQVSQAVSQTSDPRMQALAAASVALAANHAYEAVKAGQALENANLADQAGGINLSVSLGSSKSQSTSTSTSSNAVSSLVQAGNNLSIQATAGDLNVVGNQLQAGNNALLAATDNINLLAAANTSSSQSNSSGSGASIGVGFNLGAKPSVSVTVSANSSQGNSNGNDTTYTNSSVSAGNTASLSSGSDTTLKGAQVSAKQVLADVGGNLNIETLQDTSTYKENGSSSGFSLTVPIIGTNWGIGGGIGQTKIDSDYRSAHQQSGIQTGDGGFQINVQGNTDLKGAVIASNQKAINDGNNLLITGTLTTSDLQNKASYSGQSINLGIGYSSDGKGTGTNQEGQPTTGAGQTPGSTLSSLNGWSATPPVALSASGEASGTTKSAISQGTVIITDDAKQQALTGKDGAATVASLNRDTQNANGSIAPIFNKDEIKAGFAITQTFVQQVGTFINDQAVKADAAKAALKGEQDKPIDQQDAIKLAQLQKAVDEATQWGPGGTYRQVLTALTAASSGNVTASGGQFLQSIAVDYLQGLAVQQVKSIADSFMDDGKTTVQSEAVRTALQALTACAGAAAQNQSCGAGAMGAAASVVLNNALNALTGLDSDKISAQQKEAQRNLVATLVAGIATAGGDNAATAANAAILEMENNGLKDLLFPRTLPQQKFLGKNVKTGAPEEKIATIDKDRGKLILIQPADKQLYASAISEDSVPGYFVVTAHASDTTVQSLDAKNLANVIRTSGAWDGKTPIMLDACNSGKIDAGVASQLAKELGVDVIAPTTQTWNFPLGGGAVGQGAYRKLNDYLPDLTSPGIWRTFDPNGNIVGFSEKSPRDKK